MMDTKVETIAVVGLGYVGIPLAVAFSNKVKVIGFDINKEKIQLYKSGIDVTNEVGNEIIKGCSVYFTSTPEDIREASFIIIAVPTPVDKHNNPDLKPVSSASKTVGLNMRKDAVVVYESTVYPGVTEEICVPILEKESGLKCGTDFKVGYSPERINPGDKLHRLETITKIVSGIDAETLEIVAKTYEMIVTSGVYRASSIKVAEAAKVIENSQRDINIAFVNELSMIFDKMGIDTLEVLEAAGTKWNFLNFKPGLVGGHCIGVDPYYLTYKAQEVGYHSQVILAGRRINDCMGSYVAGNVVKLLIKDNCPVNGAKVLILGITFKENVPDVRNSKVVDIVRELQEYGITVYIEDPFAETDELEKEYQLSLCDKPPKVNAVVLAVAHDEYKQLSLKDIIEKLVENSKVLIDIKGIFNSQEARKIELKYWRL